MKHLFQFITTILLLITIVACNQKPEKTVTEQATTIDLKKVEQSIVTFADEYYNKIRKYDMEFLSNVLMDDGLFCGTDPSEFWTKQQVINLFEGMKKDSINIDYTIDARKIVVAPDGNSAILMQQELLKHVSKKVPMRFTAFLIKDNDNWKINYISWALIPKNEELGRIDEALEVEE